MSRHVRTQTNEPMEYTILALHQTLAIMVLLSFVKHQQQFEQDVSLQKLTLRAAPTTTPPSCLLKTLPLPTPPPDAASSLSRQSSETASGTSSPKAVSSLHFRTRNSCYLTDLHLPENRVIHMDHKDVWGSVELAPRLNVTMTCKQIQQETDTMFFANNTFLFQAQDRRANYGVLGHAADWLETLSGKQRDSIASIVVCSNQRKAMLEWAWVCAGYIELDFGLEVGERIDKEVYKELECGKMVHDFESWGKEDGHHCNKAHYLLAPKKGKGKAKAKANEKHVVEIIER